MDDETQAINTEIGWLRPPQERWGSPYSRSLMLTPFEAMFLVGLDGNTELGRRIWQYFCAHRVQTKGISSFEIELVRGDDTVVEQRYLMYEGLGPHRVGPGPGGGKIEGFKSPHKVPAPDGVAWGYDPVSVAKLRATFDCHELPYQPNLADSLGLTVWLVGTDRFLAVKNHAPEPTHGLGNEEVLESGYMMRSVTAEYLAWPSVRARIQLADYAEQIDAGLITELAPPWQLLRGQVHVSPLFDDNLNPYVLQASDEAEKRRHAEIELMSDEELDREEIEWRFAHDDFGDDDPADIRAYRGRRDVRRALVRAMKYEQFHVARHVNAPEYVQRFCKTCGASFPTDDKRVRYCERHDHKALGTEFDASRKRASRKGITTD